MFRKAGSLDRTVHWECAMIAAALADRHRQTTDRHMREGLSGFTVDTARCFWFRAAVDQFQAGDHGRPFSAQRGILITTIWGDGPGEGQPSCAARGDAATEASG